MLCNNIDPTFWFRPLGIGTEYATDVYLPEVAGREFLCVFGFESVTPNRYRQ